jgi:Flp pilus assembly protein TadG
MKHINQANRCSGQSLVEVISGLVLMFGILLGLVDLGAVIYAISLNDAACRNAASAAAVGSPSEANYRAQVIVDRANSGGLNASFAHFSLILPVKGAITAQPALQVDNQTGQTFCPGGLVTGNVEVTTEVEVKPFVVGILLKGKTPLIFKSTQTFPMRYMQPAGITSSR